MAAVAKKPIPINPHVFSWAREWAGVSVERAAKKANVPVERLEAWEDAESDDGPTVHQARELGGGDGTMDHKEYTNLKVGELAAQVQASHDRLATKIEGLSAKLDTQTARLPSRTWLVVNSVAVVAVILAVLSMWAGGYTGGFGASAAYSGAISAQDKKIEEADRSAETRAARIEAAIDGLIRRMDEK